MRLPRSFQSLATTDSVGLPRQTTPRNDRQRRLIARNRVGIYTPPVIINKIQEVEMIGNSFGRIFRVTTCGESYGKGKGSGLSVIIDGVPPGLKITKEIVQKQLDKRKPGVGKLNSPRKETDQCEIFAGIGQDGVTTGAPVGIMIYNVDTQKLHIDQYRA